MAFGVALTYPLHRICSIQETDSITSLSLSRDSKYALVNISSQVCESFYLTISIRALSFLFFVFSFFLLSFFLRGNFFIRLNVFLQEIHMWDLSSRCLVRKFYGQKQGKFVIRSCFGGVNDSFVVSGSEGMHAVMTTYAKWYCAQCCFNKRKRACAQRKLWCEY
jgi:hypothetical protein